MDGVHFQSFQSEMSSDKNQFQSSLEEGSMKENIMKVEGKYDFTEDK